MDGSLAPSSDVGKLNMLDWRSASRIVGEENLDQQLGHRVRMLSDRVKLRVSQFCCLVAEQLSAPQEARWLGASFEVDDLVHTRRRTP
jgi:hypothetical protein